MKKKRSKRFYSGLSKRAGAVALSAAMVAGNLYSDALTASAFTSSGLWKTDVLSALDDVTNAQTAADTYAEATEALQSAYDSLESSSSVEGLIVTEVGEDYIKLEWAKYESDDLVGYNVYWADANTATTEYLLLDKNSNNSFDETATTIGLDDIDADAATVSFTVKMSTFKNLWFQVAPVTTAGPGGKCEPIMSPTAVEREVQLEKLNRGLTVTMTSTGAFLNWRLFADEVSGYSATGLTGVNFNIYRGEEKVATVTDSTNYLDTAYTGELTANTYKLVPVDKDGNELTEQAVTACDIFTADASNANTAYLDIPVFKPASTTIKETYGVEEIALGGYTWTDSGYGSANDVLTYSINDASVGDVDGDGEYEYIIKWDPSHAKDVSQLGYTGKGYIDCYEVDGTLLWRLDLGINIRTGAHYTQFAVYDFDNDGKAEMMLKTAPGTKMITYELDENGKNVLDADGNPTVAAEDYVNISEEDAAAGVTNESNFVMSAEDYRQHLIDVFMDWGVWSRYSEEIVEGAIEGHWSGNLVEMLSTSEKWSDKTFYKGDGASNSTLNMGTATVADIQAVIPEYKEGDMLVNVALRDNNDNVLYTGAAGTLAQLKTVRVEDVQDYYGGYDLASVNFDATGIGYTEEQATILADYFLKHYQYRMKKHNLNTWEGYVLKGPEYLTLFDCSNGAELDTVDYYFGREDDGMLWGDYAMNYMEPGNRVDRYNVAVAYLDGETPSAVFGRGYYTRTTLEAYNVVDDKIQMVGNIDSGWTVMTNPFNDGPHGMDGNDPVNGAFSGNGNHQLPAADIDGDGCQEIINGGAIVSYKNGQMYLYSSGTGTNANSGVTSKYGHGDMIHITDMDPDRPGLEIASCFEGGASAPYNWAVRDARANVALFGVPGSKDHGRTSVGDFNTSIRGYESTEGYDIKGNIITSTAGTNTNHSLKWSADMSTQFLGGTTVASITGQKDGKSVTYVTATGHRTNNDTKGNPSLTADLFGDSREEIILHDTNSTYLRIYMNTEVSTHKNYTLMQNPQYRVGVAGQNSAYNMPNYVDYYYASDMTESDWARVTVPNTKADQAPGKVEVQPTVINLNKTVATVNEGATLQLEANILPAQAEQTATWTVDEAGAAVVSVDANGLVTAIGGGVATVTATTANGLTASATIHVIEAYEEDGLDVMPIGTSYVYKFGTNEVAEGENAVTAASAYAEATGYGWEATTGVTLTDGADYVAGNNVRTTTGDIVTWEYPTFVVDVPVGIYDVKIVQGTNGTDKAVNGAYVEGYMYASRWSNVNFGTSYDEPAESSWIWTEAGETQESTVTVAVPDGQLTIDLATSLTNEGVSGTTYIKEIVVTRKEQKTGFSEDPTLSFIGDSTLAKYPPEDGGNWTPIPERTGWGEEFSMGKFVDEDVVLVNKAVAGSSLKSYIYDGYYNDFFLNSNPGDTVIIESGINDSAAGRRYSDATEFEAGLRYLIESCEAFGLNVIISSGTSSSTTYTAKMESLATEYKLPYVKLLELWNSYATQLGINTTSLTVDGTHLKRVGGILASQIVANEIKELEGYSISGHMDVPAINYEAPTAVVSGVHAKTQAVGSLTLAWSIDEDTMYDPNQLITGFNVYRKDKADGEATLLTAQTAYVYAGMEGPQLYTVVEAPETGSYYYYVTAVGVTGEGPASAEAQIAAFEADASYTLLSLVDTYGAQLYDGSVYTVESNAALKLAVDAGKAVLADADATEDELAAAITAIEEKAAALQLNAVEFVKSDFQSEAVKTAPWGVSGSHSSLMSCIAETTGNRMLKLYVEAAGGRTVNKVFTGAADVNAAIEMVEFEWYPGKVDTRNVTEVEFYSTDANRVISLKTADNGHIGYVTGNYPADEVSIAHKQGSGFHDYEGSKAVDLGLTNEAWYNVKIVFNFADSTADLFIVPRDDASIEGVAVENIAIETANSNTITKMNYLLARGKNAAGGNDLSILWDSYYDNYAIYYANEKSTADATAYEAALAAYEAKVAGLSSAVMAGAEIALAEAVVDVMEDEVGFFTAADYAYAVEVLNAATAAAPTVANTTSVTVAAEETSVIAGLTTAVTATLSEGANEEIVWYSSDETIATVDGIGTNAVVTAKKAGDVTITAKGANSEVTGSADITVIGEAYFFGSDVTADSVYNAEAGYGFVNHTYPEAAKGLVDGVYYDRELVEVPGASFVNVGESTDEYLAINGQVWGEKAGDRDEDLITYENTSAFVMDKKGDYTVGVTFFNPNKATMNVMVKAEDIRRYDFGDHETAQLGQVSISGGQTATVLFDLAVIDEQMTLRFEQNVVDASAETAGARTVYVKSVSVLEHEDDVDYNEKTTIFTAGDSTVQSYTRASYRNGWAQLLYTMFGEEVEVQKNKTGVDGEDTGWAYYETEDTVVVNYARDARSAKSFREEGRLNELLLDLDEGDYVFVQFAHNDDNAARPNRFLSVDEYKEYLLEYNEAIAERGATLVLVTPIVLNVWEGETLDHRFDDYRLGMMQIAAENDIPVLDLMGSTLELVTKMGATNVNALALYMSDTTHTQPAGAKMFAQLVGNQLVASDNTKLDALKALIDVTNGDNSIVMECVDTIAAGQSAYITVTATSEAIDFYSSDETVAKVVDGNLVAVAPGTAIITAGYVVGDVATVDCTAYTTYKVVTVTEAVVEPAPEPVIEVVTVNEDVLTTEVAEVEVLTDDGVVAEDGNVTVYTDAEKEGMMASPLDAYQFDFGYKNGNAAAPFTSIVADAYDATKGYGFISDTSPFSGSNVANHRDDRVVANGEGEYDLTLYNAVKDGARAEAWEFAIDLTAGEYIVNVYVGDGGNNNFFGADYYINGVEVSKDWANKGETYSVDDVCISSRVVLSEDAQVVIKGENSGKLALLSAITVNEYVEKVDAYNADAWTAVADAVASLKFKASMFADDSTPLDYDAVLVSKMVETKDALDGVAYMTLADTTEGDELYELAVEATENKLLYTDASMLNLEAAMAVYDEAKEGLDIKATVREASDVIEFWLGGVNTEFLATTKPYAGYFDFNNTQTSSSGYNDALLWEAAGWTAVGVTEGHPALDLYSAETGYGLAAASTGRNRGGEDLMLADWAAADTTFLVDLPAGEYNVTTYSVDIGESNKAKSKFDFYVDYVDSTNTGTNVLSFAEVQESGSDDTVVVREGSFVLEEAKTVTMVSGGYVNGVIFEQVMEVEVAEYDIALLEALIASVNYDNQVEEDYSVSSWAVFEEAYEKATALVAAAPISVQEGEMAYDALEAAYAGLVLRAGIISYNIDFGPAVDSTNGDPQIETAGQSSGDFTSRAVEGAVRPEFILGTGAELYETNITENGFHWGFDQVVNSGNTTNGGAYFRDWVYAADKGSTPYTFKADLPAGDYFVFVYTGMKETYTNVTKLIFGNEVLETTNAATETNADGETVYVQQYNTGGQYPYANATYVLHVEENPDALSTSNRVHIGTLEITVFDDTNASDVTGCMNGIEIFPVRLDAPKEVVVDKEFPFTDVNKDGWEYSGINYVFQKGIMSGVDATTFNPDGDLTRAMFVQTLYAMEGKPAIEYTAQFPDVPEGQWYTDAVLWAYENGVTAGKEDGNFGVEDKITREQLALMVYKYALSKDVPDNGIDGSLESYEDAASVSTWAVEALEWATRNGVVNGMPGSTEDSLMLAPTGNATRAQCAAILRTYCEAVENDTIKADVNKSDLQTAVDAAKALDATAYTEDSYAAVTTAVTAAEAAIADEAATQATVDAALAALNAAVAALEEAPEVDTTALATAVDAAKALDATAYTEDSYAAVTTAVTAAEAVLADAEATQEEVDAALTALNAAVAALVEAEDEDAIVITGTQIGSTNLDTAFFTAFSDIWAVANGESKTVNFKNYGACVNNWDNFVVVLQNVAEGHTSDANKTDLGYNASYAEYAVLRPDNYGWGTGYSTAILESAWNWDTFKSDLNGADVEVTVTNNGTTADVVMNVTTAAGTEYVQSFTGITITGDLYFCLSCENSCLDLQAGTTAE